MRKKLHQSEHFHGWLLLSLLVGCGQPDGELPKAEPENLAFPPPPADAEIQVIAGRSLVIRNARLVDGTGSPARADIDVWIEDGRIRQLGHELVTPELPVIDATGLTLLPGLITSHAHVQSVPGSTLRRDDIAAVETQQRLQLRAYLASGFTTVLDPAIGVETGTRLRAEMEAGAPGPELFVLAPFLTPVEGYMTSPEMRGVAFEDFWPAIDAQTDLDALFEQAAPLDSVGVKVAVEDGVLFPNLPLFDDPTFERIREAGRDHRLYVHSISNEEHRRALELEPYALVHMGLWDEDIAPDVLATLAERQTPVISTITLNHLAAWGWTQSFADDPWIQQRVPVIQWETALDPVIRDHLDSVAAEMMRPWWIPYSVARIGAPLFSPTDELAAEASRSGARAIAALEAAGVPWVVGADEGNAPVYTSFFHGVASQIELEQLELGGIDRQAILAACTTRPARMLEVDHRIGTVQTGWEADLILVEKDPMEHGMTALRTLRWTINNGEARTPMGWLHEP